MKQTAVKWLQSEIDNKDMGEIPMWIYEFIEQAKEMEKQQMWAYVEINYVNGVNSLAFHKAEFEQYYNETYNQ